MDSNPSVPSSSPVSTSPEPAPEIVRLQDQFHQMLRVVVVMAILLAAGQALELWRCWQAREAAQTAGRLRYNLQHMAGTLEEFRRLAAGHPELVAMARKYGLEPLPATAPATAPAAGTNRPAARP